MRKNNKEFNIIINGVGGQGLITLLKIIAEAALLENYDIRTSELHGLSQRGGSVEVHIRFGQKVYSPLIPQGKANLVLSLESQEALNGLYYSSKDTIFLVNKYHTPTFLKDIPEKDYNPPTASSHSHDGEWAPILKTLKQFSRNIFLIPSSEICQKEFGTDVVAGIYFLGFAIYKKFLSLKQTSIISAIKKTIPEKYLDLNIKTFKLSKKYAK